MKKVFIYTFVILVSLILGFNLSEYRLEQPLEAGCHRIHDSMMIRFNKTCVSEISDGYFHFPRAYAKGCLITAADSYMYRFESDHPVYLSIPISDIVPTAKTSIPVSVSLTDGSHWEGGCPEEKNISILDGMYSVSLQVSKELTEYTPELRESLPQFFKQSYVTDRNPETKNAPE